MPLRAALRAMEQQYRDLFEACSDAILAIDGEGRIVDANPAALQLLGYARDELLSRAHLEITAPPWRAATQTILREQVASRGYSDEYEKEYVRKDGSVVGVVVRAFVRRDHEGRPDGAWAIVRDLGARSQTEQALRQSEERFRLAFQTSLDSIAISRHSDGVFVSVNDAFTRMTGWTAAEVVGRSGGEVGIWVDPVVRAGFFRTLATEGSVSDLETTSRTKDGRVFPVLLSAKLMEVRGERYIVSTAHDLTALRRAEEERDRLRGRLYEAAKMEIVGQLAGGVAHDFNNLLTVILAGAEALRETLAHGAPPDPAVVDEVADAGRRARDLTRQLLAFARRQVSDPVPLDLNALVSGCEKLLRRAVGEDVRLVLKPEPQLWTVRCDRGQLEQVLLNLAVNARDAMGGRGTLTLETSNAEVDPGFTAWLHTGPCVRLRVRDTGHGMTPEVKEHLFEPFFTTKARGKGTGLGLATVYGMVKQNDGHIVVESEAGAGTAFDLYFPRFQGPARTTTRAEPALAVEGGTETVLVVEDDAVVRQVTVRVLRSGGYEVLEARDRTEALERVRGCSRVVDLIVSDVVMPGEDGPTVVEDVRRLLPGVRVLYISGHAHDTLARHGLLGLGKEFLPKPFTRASLLARVRALLDGPRAAGAQGTPPG